MQELSLNKPTNQAEDREKPISQDRRVPISYRLAAIALGCLPFVAAECCLRVAGIPAVQSGVDEDPIVDLHQLKPLFQISADQSTYSIPDSRMNFFRPAKFAAQKAAGSKRIFVLGGSTVQGRPYATETAFSSWLSIRLAAADPNTRFEVINCGGVSYASYRVAKILSEVLQHQPDAIVIYTGHNEFLEDRSYDDIRNLSDARSWISQFGSSIHTVRLIKNWTTSQPSKPTLSSEVDARLDHTGGMESYHRDEQWRHDVVAHFQMTLHRMIGQCQSANVPLVLCVPSSDIVNTPPFKVEAREAGTKDTLGRPLEKVYAMICDDSLPTQKRMDGCMRYLNADPKHAGANYVLGRLSMDLGDFSAAKQYLISARDNDVCPLRATTEIVNSVAEITESNMLKVVSIDQVLDERSLLSGLAIPDGIPDPEYFVDHLHPSITGHQKIAERLAVALKSLGWKLDLAKSTNDYTERIKQHLQKLDESYFARGKQRLEGLQKWTQGRAGELGIED